MVPSPLSSDGLSFGSTHPELENCTWIPEGDSMAYGMRKEAAWTQPWLRATGVIAPAFDFRKLFARLLSADLNVNPVPSAVS